jgi:hypothetical protein
MMLKPVTQEEKGTKIAPQLSKKFFHESLWRARRDSNS